MPKLMRYSRSDGEKRPKRSYFKQTPPIEELRTAGDLAPGEPRLNEELYEQVAMRFYKSWCQNQNPAGLVVSSFKIVSDTAELGQRVQGSDPAFSTRVAEVFADRGFGASVAALGGSKSRHYLAIEQIVCLEISCVEFGTRWHKNRGVASVLAKGTLQGALLRLRAHYRDWDQAHARAKAKANAGTNKG